MVNVVHVHNNQTYQILSNHLHVVFSLRLRLFNS